jgi:hypothetical protein
MKAIVNDPDALRALGPLDVAAYLRIHGWKQVESMGDKGSVWDLTAANGEQYEILLPLRPDLGDFLSRMADTVRVLELAEQRSQLEILRDLTTSATDIIRIRSQQPDTHDGTISIDDGVDLVQRARDMLLAAACATVQPRPYFPTRKPTPAVEYMERVRLGQTERGSYVVTLLSRVPPALEPTRNGQAHLDIEEPFERRVTLTLARSLKEVRKAAQESAVSGGFDAFEAAVADGVSANLCEAVAALAGSSSEARGVEVDLTWSPRRPLEFDEPRRIVLAADTISVIREAGRLFRETSPRDDFELMGIVIRLERTEPSRPGKITLLGFVDEAARKVTLELSGGDYDLALDAHRRHQPVRCQGQLVRAGNVWELKYPQWLELVEPD